MTEEELRKFNECFKLKKKQIDDQFHNLVIGGKIVLPSEYYSVDYLQDCSVEYKSKSFPENVKKEINKAIEECRLFVAKG
jgi:hypothetical protein